MNGAPPVARPFREWARADTTRASNRIPSSTWIDRLALDPSCGRVCIVIDLRMAGTAIRLSRDEWRSLGTSDEDVSPSPVLLTAPDVLEDRIAFASGGAGARKVSFSFRAGALDPQSRAPYRVVAGGAWLGGVAEVALELVDQYGVGRWSERVVWMRGIVTRVRFGIVAPVDSDDTDATQRGEEFVEVEIEDPREAASGACPPWVIDDDGDRFTSPHVSALGARLPLAVNSQYRVPCVRITSNTTGAQKFVFAQGTGWTINKVFVNGVQKLTGDATYGWTQYDNVDGTGVQYSAISFTNGATAWVDSDCVHCTFDSATQAGPIGTIRAVLDACSALGVAGLSARAFSESTTRIPPTLPVPPATTIVEGSIAAPRVFVNASSGGNATRAIDYVEQAICESFPMITMAWTDGGYGPVVVDSRAGSAVRLTAGTFPLVQRSSLVEHAPRDLRTSFVFRYNYDPILDLYQSVMTRDATNNAVCAAAEALLGYRVDHPPIESVLVSDDSTASYVLDWLVAHMACPAYEIEYTAYGSAWFGLRCGDPVLLTDASHGFVDARGMIESMSWQRGAVAIRLRLWLGVLSDRGGGAGSMG